MNLKNLFKRTSTGATQQWCKEIDGGKYRTLSGQVGGAITTSAWTVCTGKNIGRSNETTPEDQALLEVTADYTKKLSQGGYFTSIEDIDGGDLFKPMLAKSYDDIKPGFPVASQPKLDGIRCIATARGLFSRTGKPIMSVPHVAADLVDFFDRMPDAILDGELYADKLSQDFNKIMSLVRKADPDAAELAESAAIVQYHVYDLPSLNGTFHQRSMVLSQLSTVGPSVVIVKTDVIETQERLDELNGEYVGQGYEGQMIRVLNSKYENKRSNFLLKRKSFVDGEFTIVAIEEGVGNRSGMAGRIIYELGDGRQFGSGVKGSHEYARELLRDEAKYVGGQGTVRFFTPTPGGIPRFPVTVAVFEGQRDI